MLKKQGLGRKQVNNRFFGRVSLSVLILVAGGVSAQAADTKFDGVALTLASQNDPFSSVLAALAPAFEEETGIKVSVDIMNYGELLTKTTADFVGDGKGIDIVTMDNVWSGLYAEQGYTVDLSAWIERDSAELNLDDIYPVAMQSLGGVGDMQIAFPFSGYANVLAYRTDLYSAAGIEPPKTMEELIAAAKALTLPDQNQFGWVANGQKGAAGAQDWLSYNNQLGGAILDENGAPTLNSSENVASLIVYQQLFEETAPPAAVNYDWGAREESFRQGLVANMQTWSVGAASYNNPEQSKVSGDVGISLAPTAEGVAQTYGFGGWGLGINSDIDELKQEAAWLFIKWVTSPAIEKQAVMMGSGGMIRLSTVSDPDVVEKYPFMPVIHTSFVNGDGEYRPRIPQYPEIQDLLGTAVNAVLTAGADPQQALDEAQAKAERLF